MVSSTSKHKFIENTKQHSTAQEVYNKKGTKYIEVNVANKYQFIFSRTGKTLLEIVDVSWGEYVVYKSKETEIWLNSKGSKDVYEKAVIPTVKMFLKKYPN